MALVRAVVLGLGLTVAAEKVHAGEAPNPALVSTASTAHFMAAERQSVAHSDFLVAHPRAYQLYWDVDVPLVMIGAALALGRQVRMANSSAPAYCVTLAEGCNKSDLNALDRPFAGTYNQTWGTLSDYAVAGFFAAPWPMLWANNSLPNAANDVFVIYESALLAFAISTLATASVSRARPLVYGSKAPESERIDPDAALSFASGHSTLAFALATSTFWTIHRRHGPSSAYSWVALACGSVLATAVASARVAAGEHFPSDVAAGAALGAATGTLVPALHGRPIVVLPRAEHANIGFSISGVF